MHIITIHNNDVDNVSNVIIIQKACLFACFELNEQFFSYLAAATIAGDRTANLDCA
jgi:hypothetical protein